MYTHRVKKESKLSTLSVEASVIGACSPMSQCGRKSQKTIEKLQRGNMRKRNLCVNLFTF